MFGFDNNYHKDSRIVSSQTLSGTGALKIISDFLAKFKGAPIYLSNPSYGNHKPIFINSGLEIREYRYFDKKTKGFDFDGMIEDLKNAQPGSIILL